MHMKFRFIIFLFFIYLFYLFIIFFLKFLFFFLAQEQDDQFTVLIRGRGRGRYPQVHSLPRANELYRNETGQND